MLHNQLDYMGRGVGGGGDQQHLDTGHRGSASNQNMLLSFVTNVDNMLATLKSDVLHVIERHLKNVVDNMEDCG